MAIILSYALSVPTVSRGKIRRMVNEVWPLLNSIKPEAQRACEIEIPVPVLSDALGDPMADHRSTDG
jgi:hypothetical protein